MTENALKQIFTASCSDLPWTVEEEEAFNLITPMEWPRPTLRVIFARRVHAVVESVRDYLKNHSSHFRF